MSFEQMFDFKFFRLQVAQRGPYVYQERETKIDVTFASNLIRFYFWHRQTFDKERTKAECGQDCSEDDEVDICSAFIFNQPLRKKHCI